MGNAGGNGTHIFEIARENILYIVFGSTEGKETHLCWAMRYNEKYELTQYIIFEI